MSDINVTEQILTLVKGVSELTSKVDAIQTSLKDVPQRISVHDTRLDQIEISLQRGNQRFTKMDDKFDKFDARLDKLEQAEGEKAKTTMTTIRNYIITALAGAVLSNIPTIISALSNK